MIFSIFALLFSLFALAFSILNVFYGEQVVRAIVDHQFKSRAKKRGQRPSCP